MVQFADFRRAAANTRFSASMSRLGQVVEPLAPRGREDVPITVANLQAFRSSSAHGYSF
jgi:hypothetical protein